MRAAESAEKLQYWDAVLLLQAFTEASVENRELFVRVGQALSSKTSRLAPKHILDLFAVYEAHGLRPRALYVELFHAIMRLSRSMYAEELSLTLQALARYNLGNPTVVAQLIRTMVHQIKEFRLRYLCGATGALGALQACPADLIEELDKHARFEIDTVPTQELLENLQAFSLLEFSWKPYEDMCLEELVSRTRTFTFAGDMNQFADPFGALRFMHANNLVHKEFLDALCQWCLEGVHKPNVLSERRPTARQLLNLHDHCREMGMEDNPALKDALAYYVESAGGKWQSRLPRPLAYHTKRSYIRTEDPLEGHLDADAPRYGYGGDSQALSQQSQELDIFGLPDVGSDELSPLEGEVDKPVRNLKPSQSSALLEEGESLLRNRVGSRKSPRPRHRRDPGLKRMLRKDMPRLPLWCQGGWGTRPKYQQGVITKKYPWAGYPTKHNGAARILRR